MPRFTAFPYPRWTAAACLLLLVSACQARTEPPRPEPAPPDAGISVRQLSPDAISSTADAFDAQPALNLVSAMVPWNRLEPEDQRFELDQLNANVEDARQRGYRIILRVMAGRLVPSWLAGTGMATVEILGTDANAFDFCEPTEVPIPWDPILEEQYGELLTALGAWMQEPDGAGGMKGDHIAVVPISMPSQLGTEMQIGFGPSIICPDGTRGAGTDLAKSNRERWLEVAPVEELRSLAESAWVRAIALHMERLPGSIPSVIAYGGLFGDEMAAAERIARTQVPRYADRLWSMFTNLQPLLDDQGDVAGPWSAWCPPCDRVLAAASGGGGEVGLQLAARESMDESSELTYAIDDALSRYEPRFLEVNEGIAVSFASYLFDGPDSVQAQIVAMSRG